MNPAADLGGIFIVPDVTALAFAPVINNMRQAGLWETDWIVISSEETTGLVFFCLVSCGALKTFTRDEVLTRVRLYKDSYPDDCHES